ncbi:MAG: hypothetical protein LBV74_13610 [Tannerella sp.]|jgi:hypothetical protein|nr:hypothetical protein [Tannerella sp.]
MKKLFVKISIVAVFMAILLVNVSINAKKNAGDAHLAAFISEANAGCESSSMNNGRCSAAGTLCLFSTDSDCDPQNN